MLLVCRRDGEALDTREEADGDGDGSWWCGRKDDGDRRDDTFWCRRDGDVDRRDGDVGKRDGDVDRRDGDIAFDDSMG